MPIVEVTLTSGRSPAQLRALIHRLTGAVHEAIGAPIDAVRVIIFEVPDTHLASGDVTIDERSVRRANPLPSSIED